MNPWEGDFGRAYTDRNPQSGAELDALYLEVYGKTATELYREFLGHLPKDMRILEAGCNVGCQLEVLQGLGFTDLYGLDIQWYAVEKAQQRLKKVHVLQGDAGDIPYKDGFFDLVFTAGMLIHIPLGSIPRVINELGRCARQYIWGFECFSTERKEIIYREQEDMMWVDDFSRYFGWKYNQVQKVQVINKPYRDEMYLLERP